MHRQRVRRHGTPGQAEPMHAVSWAGATCSVDDCTSDVKARGMCLAHYKRWRRWGDPTIIRPLQPVHDRFWAKVDKEGPVSDHRPDLGQCWIWMAGRTAQGYGGFHPSRDVTTTAHRWAYSEAHGGVSPDHHVDHLCRERLCVNPSHLEAVPPLENLRRGKGYGIENGMRSTCVNGHEYTPENTYTPPTGAKRCRVCQKNRDHGRSRTNRKETF